MNVRDETLKYLRKARDGVEERRQTSLEYAANAAVNGEALNEAQHIHDAERLAEELGRIAVCLSWVEAQAAAEGAP